MPRDGRGGEKWETQEPMAGQGDAATQPVNTCAPWWEQGKEHGNSSVAQSTRMEMNCFARKKSRRFAEALGVCMCGCSDSAEATLDAWKNLLCAFN